MIRIIVLLLACGAMLDAAKGPRVEREESKEDLEPIWSMRPDLDCTTERIDAATMTNKKTYFFKGEWYWRLIKGQVAPGYPRLITQDWSGLPGHLDAALTWKDGRTFFFKGKQYWSFHDRQMDDGYPRNISEGFGGIPGSIDAAVLHKHTNYAYYFKGEQYWRFDGGESCIPVDPSYPLSIQKYWPNLPTKVEAALQWEDGHTYFIKNGNSYKYDVTGAAKGAEKAIPLHKNWGLKCSEIKCRIPPVQFSDMG